ncbi:unnamed protein product [Owenia fusiformis]|uniref:protein O-GlcNAcase n=1 Tax=Owenia fusiformis TaxID=6347 RepID=A0A8S4NS09_OWEFU|nr:unnamed protein product [Owenia fusiformis]
MDDNFHNNRMNTSSFFCGVVEGFYGRPWTTEQRKDLFKRMRKMGMNTYLYAPKDDYKHRAYWRDLYSVEEAEHLTNLISAAEAEGVTFLYALSPGLDITFSSTKDVQFLKRKLEQVQRFGCKAFSLLFDDIDSEMSSSDKEMFQSFAHAQVSVTNETFQHLEQPTFLFCPTEYCASRAVPTVSSSEYLNTIGAKLLPGVDILWTGPKVISKRITIQAIEEITKVLQRPPIIWDNIHANDYDQKRLFLGPYNGRSSELIPYLRGVLTNPNCEYEANFIAFHTLGQWCKCNASSIKKDVILSESPVCSDIKLETDGEDNSDLDDNVSEDDTNEQLNGSYKPRQALIAAIGDWMEEIYSTRNANGQQKTPFTPGGLPSTPILPVVNTCMSVSGTTITSTAGSSLSGGTGLPDLPIPESGNESYMQPTMNPVNSLLDTPSIPIPESSSTSSIEVEPMDCVPSPGSSPTQTDCDSKVDMDNMKTLNPPDNSTSTEKMQLDTDSSSDIYDMRKAIPEDDVLSTSDVILLADLFYLPFEHGKQACQLMNKFHWLKSHAHYVAGITHNDSERQQEVKLQVDEWQQKAKDFEGIVKRVGNLARKMTKIPNRSLLYDIYPYIWDIRGTLSLMSSFVNWLAIGHVPYISVINNAGNHQFTWSNKNYREAFMNGEQEPWVFRGGLQAELQRMLPLDGASDLFNPIVLDPASSACNSMTIVRPYLPSDKNAVFDLCRKIYDEQMDVTDTTQEYPDLVPHQLVGGFLQTTPEYCFVVEDDAGIYGYVLASLDAKAHYKQIQEDYLPTLHNAYPRPKSTENLTPAEETIAKFHDFKPFLPDQLYEKYPSMLRIDILPERAVDPNIPRRMIACVLSALKSNGSQGVHCELDPTDEAYLEFYSKLGFFTVPLDPVCPDSTIVGRVI